MTGDREMSIFNYFVDQDGYVWTYNSQEGVTPYNNFGETQTVCVSSPGIGEWVELEVYDDDDCLIDAFVLYETLTELSNVLEPDHK